MQKRQHGDRIEEDFSDNQSISSKRFKPDACQSTELVAVGSSSTALTNLMREPGRISSLMSPEVSLSGHDGAVYSISFDPTGNYLCSGSFDKQILLWDIYGGCKNYNVLSGHRNAVLQVQWSAPSTIISCSADKTVACWDTNKGTRTRKLAEHTAIVNSCSAAKDVSYLIASGSDDCTVILWDTRSKRSTGSLYHDYQVCSVCMSTDGLSVYTGGIDNIIRRFDARKGDVEVPDMILDGHSDTITGLSLSPDGHHLLSNSMDNSLRCWDVRPFVASPTRCEAILGGVHHGAEKVLLRCSWAANQSMVTAGSADRLVHMWETTGFHQLPSYPGHKGSVNEVIFHPKERIIASCSSDKQIILGELPEQ